MTSVLQILTKSIALVLAVLPLVALAEVYDLPPAGNDVVGAITIITARDDDTLLDDPTKGLVNPSNQDSIAVEYVWNYAYQDAGTISDLDTEGRDATTTITLLRWRRQLSLNGTSSWYTVNELHTFTDFKVRPYTTTGALTMIPAAVRRFYVEIEAKAPLAIGRDGVDVSQWETYIRPINLTRLD